MRVDRGPIPGRGSGLWARWRGFALLIAIVGALAVSIPACAEAGTSCGSCTLSLFGASFASPAPWDWAPVRAFDAMATKPISVLSFGSPFANCSSRCWYYKFPKAIMTKIRHRGSIPMLNWSSGSVPMPIYAAQPTFSLAQILSGRYDSYIRQFAHAAAKWGHPFLLRFDWEMNGNWFPWGQGLNRNTDAEYVSVWRHVHDIFSQAGASNVSWVWCPNVGKWASMAKLYPGAAYVNWTCLDGYNYGTTGPHSQGALHGGWKSFASVYKSAYHQVVDHIAPGKPMIIGEIGSTDQGGSKAKWITNMFRVLPTEFPEIRGLVWYQEPTSWNFAIQPGTAAARAFAAGVRSPIYAANAFCRFAGPLLPPPAAQATAGCAS